jgi:GT2 family glycosyltransferase
MNSDQKKVAIVTPVHNRRDTTLQCLRSLARIDSSGLVVTTYVVDDGSTDGTAAAIRSEFPNVIVIPGDGNLWFTEGTNVGVRAALEDNPDYVLMMNDDQVFDEGFLKSLVDCATRFPRSIVGPLLLLWDQPHRLFQIGAYWRTLGGGWKNWWHQDVWTIPHDPFEVDIIVGNCLLVPADAIREAGMMDSKRYPNFGDAEYTPRLQRRGWRLLIEPRARVFCQPNTLPPSISRMSFRDKFNSLVLDTKHPHNMRRRFRACVDGAPSRLAGVTAFTIFLIRLLVRRNAEGNWALEQPEPTMREFYRDRVLKRGERS